MHPDIRFVTAEIAGEICAVVRESITKCCVADHRGSPFMIEAWLANKTPANIALWIADSDVIALGAFRESKLVGFVLVTGATLALCYVIPEALHQGVGKALLCEVESQALKRGILNLQLESTCTAEPFYRRNGYEPCGAPRSWAGLQGQPMRKELRITTSGPNGTT